MKSKSFALLAESLLCTRKLTNLWQLEYNIINIYIYIVRYIAAKLRYVSWKSKVCLDNVIQ